MVVTQVSGATTATAQVPARFRSVKLHCIQAGERGPIALWHITLRRQGRHKWPIAYSQGEARLLITLGDIDIWLGEPCTYHDAHSPLGKRNPPYLPACK